MTFRSPSLGGLAIYSYAVRAWLGGVITSQLTKHLPSPVCPFSCWPRQLKIIGEISGLYLPNILFAYQLYLHIHK